MAKKDLHQIVKNFFDEDGSSYHARRWRNTPIAVYDFDRTKEAIEKSLEELSFPDILEIGPGPGTWTPLFLKRCKKMTLIDISENMLNIAMKNLKGNNITFIHGDISNSEIPSQFDLIASVRCFEYIRDKEAFVQKCNQMLKSNGMLLIITKSKGSYWYGKSKIRKLLKLFAPSLFQFEKYNIDKQQRLFWQSRLFVKDFRQLLEAEGFQILKIRPVIIRPPIFMRGKSEIPLVPPKFEKIFLSFFKIIDGLLNRFPFFTIFAESFIITAKK